jgi:hypothetical protein
MGFVVAGLLIIVRAFTQNVSACAGFSRSWAALRSHGPPRVLGLDRAGRGHAHYTRMGHTGRTCFLVLAMLEML